VEGQEPADSYPPVVKSFGSVLVLVLGQHQTQVVCNPNRREEGQHPCRDCDQIMEQEMTCGQMELEVACHFVIDASAEIQDLRLRVTTAEMCCGPVVQARRRLSRRGVLLVYVWCVLSCYESAGDNEGKEGWEEESQVCEDEHCEHVDFLVAYWKDEIEHESKGERRERQQKREAGRRQANVW